MGDLGGSEQVCGAVGTGSHACAATDAGGGVEGGIGDDLGDRDEIGVGSRPGVHRDVATGLDDPIERRAVDHQVADEGKSCCPPWLDDDGRPILELAHVELTGGGAQLGPVGLAVDHHAACAADSLPAVVIEGNGFLSLVDQTLVEHIEHLEKGHLVGDTPHLIGLEAAGSVWPGLTPDLERDVHL
jgi:hypothetical protein